MSKERKNVRETKKKAQSTQKEKRAAKQAKKHPANSPLVTR